MQNILRNLRAFISYLLALTLLITGGSSVYLPSASAATSTVNCGTSGYFTIIDNVVTGQTNCVGSVSIPSGVTSIAANAFSQSGQTLANQNRITSVTISNTVTSIGTYAFSHNKNLNPLTIGNSVTSIGSYAFYDNYALASVVIPNSVTTIGDSAFEWAKVLSSFTIGSGVTSLGASALRMTNITTLVIPDSVITIGADFMSGSGAPGSGTNRSAKGLVSLTIGDGVTTVGAGAFTDANSLTYLYLGRNITSMGAESISYAGNLSSFIHCGSLTSSALTTAGLDSTKKTCPVVQLPNPVATTAGAGSTSGTIKVNFSAGFGGQVATTQSGSTASSSSVQSLAIDSAGSLIYAGYYNQTNVYIRTRNARYDYSAQTVLIPWGTITVGFEALAVDSQNNVWTIGASGLYKYSRTNGTLGTGAWTESFIANSATNSNFVNNNSAIAPINSSGVLCSAGDSCTLDFDGQDNIITGSVKSSLRFWKKSDNYNPATANLIDGKYLGTWDISVSGNRVAYWAGSYLRMVEPATPYDFANATNTKYGLGNTASSATAAIAVDPSGVVFTIQRDVLGVQAFVRDQASDFTRVLNLSGTTKGNAAEFDPYGDLIFGSSGAFQVIPKISAPGQAYTAKVYASDGTTLLQTVNNYVSGSDISGLAGSTTYKVTVTADASSGYLASSASNMLSAATAVDPPTISSNTISGTATAGQTLSNDVTTTGTISRVWKRDGVAISGATAGTYTLVAADVDSMISVTATSTNASGSTSSTSATFGPILASIPSISSAIISGNQIKGETLTASSAGVTGLPAPTASYVWNRDGVPISGAQSSTYLLTTADINAGISVTITVTNAAGSASATSTGTSPISKMTPTFTWANVSKPYGETFTITSPSPSTPGTFTYSSGSTSVVTINGNTATVVGRGTALITATFTPDDAANFIAAGTSTMTITAGTAAITVTPTPGQSIAYGANNPTIAYTITSGSLVESDVLSGALTFTGSNVGSYPITIGTLANSNYIITLAAVNLAITQATQNAVSLSSLSSAYNSSNKTVSLTGSGGSGTGGYTYLLDASNTTPGCSVSGSTLTYITAGTCVIAVTRTSDTNYLARTDVVSFSIGLASQTIIFGSLTAKSYSSDTFTVSASSSSSLTVVFTSGSTSVCTTSGSNGAVITLLGVGTCVINANQVGDSNTSAASEVSQNFAVNPRAITITADAKTKVFGATDPSFTYAITSSSLILGDVLTGTLTRASGTDAGTYQIQAGTLTNANNPKYAITFVSADLVISRATPALVLTYPNSNVAILRPGATDTPTVTTSSSSGALNFATSAASAICTVDSTSGVISLFGAGSCPVVMTTAQTTNFIQYFETTTVTIALLSTSLVGIDQNNLVSMGQPFYAHPSIDQSYSFSSGSNGASVAIPAGTLDATVPISISLLTDSTSQRAIISSDGTSVLSVVVSWVAPDGSVPSTNTGKAISVTLTNPSIKSGAKIYSIIGNQSQLLGTSTSDGSVTTLITDDPVLLVINPVVAPPTSAPVIDNSAAIKAAKDLADKKAAEEAAAAVALKAAQEKMEADAKALAEAKALADAAALKAAQEAADASAKAAALLQAEKDAALAAAKAADNIKPSVTLYSLSSKLKLNAYDSAYLTKYVKSLKNGASVTCIGYIYSKGSTVQKATALAKSQATAVCARMKKVNKTLKTSIVTYPVSKAPKAATGAKWVGVSYRIDGFKNS